MTGEKTETKQEEIERAQESAVFPLEEHHETLSLGSLESSRPAGDKFEILAITAGKGNGWNFGAAVLQESVPLWDKAECFVDHQLTARSVKDLAGVLSSPAWAEDVQGIRATLRAVGPSGGVLQELGKVVLSGEMPPESVGFSADIIFTANGKTVNKVVKVLSVDLVIDPARGGQFIRELYQNKEHFKMAPKTEQESVVEQPATSLEKDVEAVRTLLGVKQEQTRLAEEAEKAKAIRVQMCEYLLSSGLSASKLPAAAAEQVRKQFAGKVFEPAELQTAIDDTRKLVSDLTANLIVTGRAGPGARHVHPGGRAAKRG